MFEWVHLPFMLLKSICFYIREREGGSKGRREKGKVHVDMWYVAWHKVYVIETDFSVKVKICHICIIFINKLNIDSQVFSKMSLGGKKER